MTKVHWMKQSRQENIAYLVVWGLLFAAPLLSLYVRTISDSNVTFDWAEVFLVWRKFAIYLVLFLVHNFLLAPLLVHQHRRVAYFSIVAVVLMAFMVYQCNSRPHVRKPLRHRPHIEQADRTGIGLTSMSRRKSSTAVISRLVSLVPRCIVATDRLPSLASETSWPSYCLS